MPEFTVYIKIKFANCCQICSNPSSYIILNKYARVPLTHLNLYSQLENRNNKYCVLVSGHVILFIERQYSSVEMKVRNPKSKRKSIRLESLQVTLHEGSRCPYLRQFWILPL